MRDLKSHVIREIERFDSKREASSDVDFSRWLNDLIDDLERAFAL